jgi:hypothetical protein
MGDDPRGQVHQLDGAIARVFTEVETTETPDGPQPIEWTRIHAGAVNTGLLMSIGNQGTRDADWHDQVWRSIQHEPRPPNRLGRLFGKR